MEAEEPVTPTGLYFNSSALCVSVLVVFELEIPFNESVTKPFLEDHFLPINTRLSSIMIEDQNGEKKWKKVEVKLEEHINNIPEFPIPTNKSSSHYDEYFDEYMSKIAMEQLPQHRPLWEVHIIKYPTSSAAETVVFKFHHALGDGYSLMGCLLSCLQRADDPSLPFTFPSSLKPSKLPSIFASAFRTLVDFGWSLLKGSLIEDDLSPLRSGADDTKLNHITISNLSLSIHQIKEVTSKLQVSINDVISGVIFFGLRLYMQEIRRDSSKAESTSLILLNTRNVGGYKSVKEMVDKTPTNIGAWANQFAFLHVPIPELSDTKYENPLQFIWDAHREIQRKKNSWSIPLSGMLLNNVKKLRGPEAAARYIYKTLRNSSVTISNIIGPVEQMAVVNHPVKGFYFMTLGSPESLTITVMSYMGKIRIGFGLEKDFIDKQKFMSCMERSFEMIITAARNIST